MYDLSPGEKDEPAAKTSRLQDSGSTRRDDKVPMNAESASLVVLRPCFQENNYVSVSKRLIYSL